jgi:hypothetical protein
MNGNGNVLLAEMDPEDFTFVDEPHEFDPVRLGRSKKGGWSGSADMVTGQDQTTPGPEFTFPFAATWTMRFGVIPPSVGSGAGGDPYANSFHCVAEITSGVEGQWVKRQISVCLATAITFTGDNANVTLSDLTLETNSSAVEGLPYRVTMQIVPGERASYLSPPTLFAFTDVINSEPAQQAGVVEIASSGASGNARYPIPPNAGVLSVQVIVATGTVAVYAAGGDQDMKSWVPDDGFMILPPCCTYIEIQSTGGGELGATFTVTWGIEG